MRPFTDDRNWPISRGARSLFQRSTKDRNLVEPRHSLLGAERRPDSVIRVSLQSFRLPEPNRSR
jgi:hypothetical protein